MVGIIRGSFAAWWRDVLGYALLNLLWVGALLTVIGGPPATAAMYQMTASSLDNVDVGPKSYWRAMRQLFLPSWLWAIVQVIVYGIIGFNLIYYASATGIFWGWLRLVWMVGGILWSGMNIFYWAFYLRQDDHRIAITYRNVLLMFVRDPLTTVSIMLLVGGLIFLSIATGVVLAFALMVLIAFLGTATVQQALPPKNK